MALVAAAAIATQPGCGRPGETAAAATGTTDPLRVRRGDFVQRFLLTGYLEAVRAVDLTVPQNPSWQTSIRWIEADGARVTAGQKLVEFDSSSFASELDERTLQREQARSDLRQKEAELAASRADREFQVTQKELALERVRSDAAIPESLLPARQWQERQLALRRAEVDLDKAVEDREAFLRSSREEIVQRRIALGKADREIDAARRAIDQMVITAPRDGIFVIADHPWEGRKLAEGDNVWVGLAIGRLPDLSAMKVKALLSDVDDGRIVPGLPAVASMDAYLDRHYRGRVDEITPVAQEPEQRSLRRSFDVTVALDEADTERMRPGMSVKVEVEARRLAGVALAPRSALDVGSGTARARRSDGRIVDVTLGPCSALECVVESGLEDGEALEPFR